LKDILQAYREVAYNLPDKILTWRLYGAGLDNFGKDVKPVQLPMPKYGPDELLVRVDAVGICFSDVKVIRQGNKHPRITGRDLRKDPVILGHEAATTVVGVGEALKAKFHMGERFVVQADVFYGGKSMAYGYVLPGAQTQYGIIGREMIEGDEGCYLLGISDAVGDAEAALTEPWACVVASYRIIHRPAIKPDGVAWFIGTSEAEFDAYTIRLGVDRGLHPRTVFATDLRGGILSLLEERADSFGFEFVQANGFNSLDIERLVGNYTGFDDIIVLGADADVIEKAAPFLAKHGIMNILGKTPLSRPVNIDVGRVHYDGHSYVGTSGTDVAASYGLSRVPSELLSEGTAWFIGAGGPMGQMHVQRAIQLEDGPKRILATDIDAERLNSVKERYISIAERRGVELQVVNPEEMTSEAFDRLLKEFTGGRGFDDIVVLAPVPALIQGAIPHLAECGLMNIFAGLARGTIASLDVSGVYDRHIRFVGSSGSRITDMQDTIKATEKGEISPNTSVSAVGGIDASWEGMRAVQEGRFPGKIVIYPQIRGLELTPLPKLKARLPNVHGKLTDGMFWNREAEDELIRTMVKIHP